MKTLFVTGASQGMGFQICKQAVASGHRVYAVSRNIAPLKTLKGVNAFTLDISDESSTLEFSNRLMDQGVKIDALINNAGTLRNLPFESTTTADFEAVYKVNVFGLASVTRGLLPLIAPEGHVVNISSMGGIEKISKFPGLAAYSSSKAAVNILTELLAEEYKATGPSFNALALGAVQTEMLEQAFPGYKAPVTAEAMGAYILRFALEGQHLYNGKILPISMSTP